MAVREEDIQELAEGLKPVLKIPWWGRVLIFIVKLLPLPPWIKLILPIIIGIIEAIPDRSERQAARREMEEAARAAKGGDNSKIEQVVKKHWRRRCEGVGCQSDLVRE